MRPLRYSINVTLDGCCDHRAIVPDEAMHRHAAENINRADALLLGRVTYELMEAGWRQPVQWSLGRLTLKTGAPYRCSRTRKRERACPVVTVRLGGARLLAKTI